MEDPPFDVQKGLEKVFADLQASRYASLVPILPLLFNLKGKPYSLEDHFLFEPFYRTRRPVRTLFKTARQVSKSTNLAASSITQSLLLPHFTTLCVTPLYEMIRRFSSNYVRPFVEESPLRSKMVIPGRSANILQRDFANGARMIFSFAFLSADRVRGVSADALKYDEIQSFDKDLLPVIRETISHSAYGLEDYAGTPTTRHGTMASVWKETSQAEWLIKCHHMGCGYWNVPSLEHDMDEMVGPLRDDISEEKPGVVCAKCKKPLHPRTGRWVHGRPALRWDFSGYHIPQIIMPLHYADIDKWQTLLSKREGRWNTSPAKFYNECMGEDYDEGATLIGLEDLQKAATLPHRNVAADAKARVHRYMATALGVDWGGGGEEQVSYTTYAVTGLRPDGHVDVIYGHRSTTPHDHIREAKLALKIAKEFGCQLIAHDYTGAGSIRETLMIHAGYPPERIMPMSLMTNMAGAVLRYKPQSDANPRSYYILDKARSLLLLCAQIKLGGIRFFQFDDDGEPGDHNLPTHFLALVEEKVETPGGREFYRITRDPALSDDFAHAVNFGSCALWHSSGHWPNLADDARFSIPSDVEAELLGGDLRL